MSNNVLKSACARCECDEIAWPADAGDGRKKSQQFPSASRSEIAGGESKCKVYGVLVYYKFGGGENVEIEEEK